MTAAQIITIAFLAVSVQSFTVQAWAFHRLHTHRRRSGVWRTAACRVGCAVIYIIVGTNALVGHYATLQVTFLAFLITQLTWQANAWLDVRQARQKGKPVAYTPQQLSHARAIRDVVKSMGLPVRVLVIALETAMTESGIKVYANANNPESLARPHEAVGTDHASVGIFQQQVPMWGSTAACMDPVTSAAKFLDRLVQKNWQSMSNWQAAQAVQVSAYPDGSNYRRNDAAAQTLAAQLWAEQPATRRRPSMYFYFVKELNGACFSYNGKFVRQFGKWPDVQNGMRANFQDAIYPMTLEQHNALLAAASRTD